MFSFALKRYDRMLFGVFCDTELEGLVLRSGRKKIDLSNDFFQWNKRSEEETKEIIKDCDWVLLCGNKCIKWALSEGIVEESSINKVNGIPFSNVFFVNI